MSSDCEDVQAVECNTVKPIRPRLELNSQDAAKICDSSNVEIEAEQVKHTKGMRGPAKPTQQEREDHERDHIFHFAAGAPIA